MDGLQKAINGLHEIDQEAERRRESSAIHPLARLFITLWYMILVVSFHKYDLAGLAAMMLYPLILALTADISLRRAFGRIKYILLPLLFVGIANPFLDRAALFTLGTFSVSGGMVSLLTICLKGLFTVCATYLLVMEVGISGICCALRTARVPTRFVTVLLLIYRYLSVFLKEIQRMMQAYRLRAPGQKGIHVKPWGPFVGLLLLRSIDRATEVYHSMLLRGYDGSFRYEQSLARRRISRGGSIAYVLVWMSALLFLRLVPVFTLAGSFFC